jgi:hypothetical protein
MVLKRIGALSCGKVMGTLYAAMGLILGGIFALISLAGVALPQAPNADANPATVFFGVGVAAVIIFPIMYGIIGFIGGIIVAAIYNVVASVVGGLEFDLESRA